jgi:hypothetical protein
MRINVYSQELTNEVEFTEKLSNTGIAYLAVRLFLHSSPMLHHPPADDDRSAVTFWLPSSYPRLIELSETFHKLGSMVRDVANGLVR